MQAIYKYTFSPHIEIPDIESSMVLSLWATESIHGEMETRTDIAYQFHESSRTLIVDATTFVGLSFHRILVGFLCRALDLDDFQVESIPPAPSYAAA